MWLVRASISQAHISCGWYFFIINSCFHVFLEYICRVFSCRLIYSSCFELCMFPSITGPSAALVASCQTWSPNMGGSQRGKVGGRQGCATSPITSVHTYVTLDAESHHVTLGSPDCLATRMNSCQSLLIWKPVRQSPPVGLCRSCEKGYHLLW